MGHAAAVTYVLRSGEEGDGGWLWVHGAGSVDEPMVPASLRTRHFRFFFLLYLLLVIVVAIISMVLFQMSIISIVQQKERCDAQGQSLPSVCFPQLHHQYRRHIDPLRHLPPPFPINFVQIFG
jgi:hypothetical protein